MSCKKCDWYKSKLSPKEDKAFTAKYKAVEPRAWLSKQMITRRGGYFITFDLASLYKAAFKQSDPDTYQLTVLGRTLDALGWTRIRLNGSLFFTMSLEEFQEYE